MAHPADTMPKEPVFAHGRLTPEQADHLASMFRPSWELDDAPFTGVGALSDADLHALNAGGGIRADLRAAAIPAARTVTNGTHGAAAIPAPVPAPVQAAVAPVNSVPAPENSVIEVDVVVEPAAVAARALAPSTKTVMGVQAPAPIPVPAPVHVAPAAPPAARASAGPMRVSQRPMAPAFVVGPPTPKSRPAGPLSDSSLATYPQTSKKGVWLGLGGVAAVLLALGIWAVSSGGSDTTAGSAATATAKPTEDKLSAIPPAPTNPPAATATVVSQIPRTPVTALPVAPPQPQPAREPVRAPSPPPRAWTYSPPPRPAPRKTGQTIVRDVPF